MSVNLGQIKFSKSGVDSYLGQVKKSERIIIKDVKSDLQDRFRKVADNVLVSLAENDLWEIADDGSFIERLFDSDGSPIKMSVSKTGAVQVKAAEPSPDQTLNDAISVMKVLEDKPGKYLRVTERVAKAVNKLNTIGLYKITHIVDSYDPNYNHRVVRVANLVYKGRGEEKTIEVTVPAFTIKCSARPFVYEDTNTGKSIMGTVKLDYFMAETEKLLDNAIKESVGKQLGVKLSYIGGHALIGLANIFDTEAKTAPEKEEFNPEE